MGRRAATATAAAIAAVLLVVLPRVRTPRQMREDAMADPLVTPRGWYTGAPMPTPHGELVARTLTGLGGPPGIRQGESTARNQTYYGTDVVPAPRYDRITVNREIDLELAAVQGTQRRGGQL